MLGWVLNCQQAKYRLALSIDGFNPVNTIHRTGDPGVNFRH